MEHVGTEQSGVTLAPQGFLRFPEGGDWRERLFNLGAKRERCAGALRFWQGASQAFIKTLCHIPQGASARDITLPPPGTADAMAAGAPPIPNGEYLTPDAVRGIWQALSEWTSENLGRESPGEFLAARAPLWKRVGRVVFLLAELKGNAQKPFAFTATFLDSLTDDGRYRHILLSAALTRYKDTRPALLKILTPVREAAARLTCIAEMLEDGTLYKSCAWTAREDHRFLLGIPDMEESGLVVSVPNWWRKRPKAPVRVQIGQGKKRLFSGRMRSLTLTSRPPLAGWR